LEVAACHRDDLLDGLLEVFGRTLERAIRDLIR
jgi:hypothetical protein